jgi:hypothetical protein
MVDKSIDRRHVYSVYELSGGEQQFIVGEYEDV